MMSVKLPPLQYLLPGVTKAHGGRRGHELHHDPKVALPAVAANKVYNALVIAFFLHRKLCFHIVAELRQRNALDCHQLLRLAVRRLAHCAERAFANSLQNVEVEVGVGNFDPRRQLRQGGLR